MQCFHNLQPSLPLTNHHIQQKTKTLVFNNLNIRASAINIANQKSYEVNKNNIGSI